MKKILLFIALFCALKANAQIYLITFAGTGASTTVNTVKVENLTNGTSLTLNGSDILSLNLIITGVNHVENSLSSEIKIWPNPMTNSSALAIKPPVDGDATISVIDITGKIVAQIQSHLEQIPQVFRLSGINKGVYLINVKGNGYQFSQKLICNSESNGTIYIEKTNDNTQFVNDKILKDNHKGVQATVEMSYTTGDRLKFTGISGIYTTTKTDIPSQSKEIEFNFVTCTDVENNNYPVVEIGSQIWMADNLKTAKYHNGDLIGTTTPSTLDIISETTPKYQWAYEGNESNVTTYGRLYTWYAVTDSRNVCPLGWHVPSDYEWTIMTNYISNNGYNYGSNNSWIAKSLASGSGWAENPFLSPGSIGFEPKKNNSSGFTALPGGYRWSDNTFYALVYNGCWWTSDGWTRWLFYGSSPVIGVDHLAPYFVGFSVRCVMD